MDEFDRFIVNFSLKTGLISGNIIYHDGTIHEGYCNSFKNIYDNQLYYVRDFIFEHHHETDENGLLFKMKKYFINEN